MITDRMVLRAAEQFADETFAALRVRVARQPGQTERAWERATAKANREATLARLRVLWRGYQLAISCVRNGARDPGDRRPIATMLAKYEREQANITTTAQRV